MMHMSRLTSFRLLLRLNTLRTSFKSALTIPSLASFSEFAPLSSSVLHYGFGMENEIG